MTFGNENLCLKELQSLNAFLCSAIANVAWGVFSNLPAMSPLKILTFWGKAWKHSLSGVLMGNIRDVMAPNIAKRPQTLFIFKILMYI
jgi:hypothetical protein